VLEVGETFVQALRMLFVDMRDHCKRRFRLEELVKWTQELL